jgi:uncharacterized protein YdiU (UPF0061 family)
MSLAQNGHATNKTPLRLASACANRHNGGMSALTTPPPANTPNADPSTAWTLPFDNTFAQQLEGCYVPWQAKTATAPSLVQLNHSLALELGLDLEALSSPQGLAVLAGNTVPPGARPVAQVYAGHQFGGFSAQLGDGRALLLGEVIDSLGQRRDIAFKGSGPTPFSRGGDGKAALGPVLREYLMGEAMHALGIPTTRALAAVATGEYILREDALPGAILTRVAASHLRVGTFQFFAARGDVDTLRRLVDYTLARHYPDLAGHDQPELALLTAVCQRQARLLAQWMAVGFIHGVMNTDNMTLSGETIDYGPCAMMDVYDPATVFSSIDRQGRYAYANQPGIARWNLTRLGECLLPLISDGSDAGNALAVQQVTDVLEGFMGLYQQEWLALMRRKMGLTDLGQTGSAGNDLALTDTALIQGLLQAMQGQNADYTQVMRALAVACVEPHNNTIASRFDEARPYLNWVPRWQQRLALEDTAPVPLPMAQRIAAMNLSNPVYIARNHKVEEALAAAQTGNLLPFETLLALLKSPFTPQAGHEGYEQPAPLAVQERYKTFCGT